MSRRIDLLRLDYVFSVVVPCLLAIYFNNLNIIDHIDIIFGFVLFAVTGNTLNDVIDARNPEEIETIERIKGYHWKEILAIAIIAFVFGFMLFIRTIQEHLINLGILITIIVMVVVYCLKKEIPIFNQILLGVSHVFLPYIMIKIDAEVVPIINAGEWALMLCFFAYAFSGQIVHEIIDGDSITRLSLRNQQLVVIISSVLSIILGFVAIVITKEIYFFPFVLIPLGSIYTFRKPTESTKGVKDVGIVLGNIILIYFLVLIVRQTFI